MPNPNVLFVLADDMGWGDVGCHGSSIDTPTIDRLMDRGRELRQHYVSPLCTPTRASFLTGCYPSRFGDRAMSPSNEPVLPDGFDTLADHLTDAGYDTGLFGKWHLGSDPEYGPQAYGFEDSYGSLAGGVDPYNHCYKEGQYSETWHRDGERVDERGHVTDLITDEATDWIAGRDGPWFCYVPYTAVHVPAKPTESWANEYESEQFFADPEMDRGRKRYAAYASHMDAAIGRLVESVKKNGQLEETLIVFASDNGAIQDYVHFESDNYPGWQWESPGLGSNHPFRGQKGEHYEGGIRAPAAVLWPDRIEGDAIDRPIGIVDWLPTLLTLIEDATPPADVDGIDVWSTLTGERAEPLERTLYWNQLEEEYAIRHGDWKWITDDPDAEGELYDIEADPYERRPREGMEDVREEMRQRLEGLRSDDYEYARS